MSRGGTACSALQAFTGWRDGGVLMGVEGFQSDSEGLRGQRKAPVFSCVLAPAGAGAVRAGIV